MSELAQIRLTGATAVSALRTVEGTDAAEVGLIHCDARLTVLDAEVTARRILGRRLDQLVGQSFLWFVVDDEVAALDALARRLVTRGLQSAAVELRLTNHLDVPVTVGVTLTHVPGHGAGPVVSSPDAGSIVLALVSGAGLGIDPDKVEAGALDERSPDLITRYRLWPEPGFDFVSPSSMDVLGYPPSAFYSDPEFLQQLVDEPAQLELLMKVYAGEWDPREPLVLHLEHRDGRILPLELRMTGVRDGEGRLLAIEAIARDVTARAEEQVRYSTAAGAVRLLYEQVATDLDDAEPMGVLQAAVDAVCTQVGWPVGHGFLLDAEPGYLISAAWHDTEADRSAILRQRTDARRWQIESDLVGDAVVLGEPVVTALPDARSSERSLVAAAAGFSHAVTLPVPVGGDIGAVLEFFTDGRRPSSALAAGVSELAIEVGRALMRSNRVLHLRKRDQARQEFVARAAHELRGPIGSIALMAAALARDARQSNQDRMASALEALATQAERTQSMATRMLELSQLEDGRVDLRLEPLPLHASVRASIAGLPVASSIPVDVDIDQDVLVTADAGLLDAILSNLLANAGRHASSSIRIEAEADDGRISVGVVDDGPGVPSELLANLFEPIAGALATPDRGGLGLALVHRMTQAMGGTVRYEPGDGGGARFVVTLPAATGTGTA